MNLYTGSPTDSIKLSDALIERAEKITELAEQMKFKSDGVNFDAKNADYFNKKEPAELPHQPPKLELQFEQPRLSFGQLDSKPDSPFISNFAKKYAERSQQVWEENVKDKFDNIQ